MKNNTQTLIHHATVNVMVICSDPDQVTEIDRYYQNLLLELNFSNRLDAQEKQGQCAFLTKQWESELDPLTELLIVKEIWTTSS